MVEHCFRDTTDKRIRSGFFQNAPDLITAIKQYIEENKQNPKVLVWTATAEKHWGNFP